MWPRQSPAERDVNESFPDSVVQVGDEVVEEEEKLNLSTARIRNANTKPGSTHMHYN